MYIYFQLKELKSYVSDGAPDIYVFTISTMRVSIIQHCKEIHTAIPLFLFLQALELKYGVGSGKVKVAAKLVEATIKKVCFEIVIFQLFNDLNFSGDRGAGLTV